MERLEEDVGQDQAQLAARGLLDQQHLAGGEEPEPAPKHHHTDEDTLQDAEDEQD